MAQNPSANPTLPCAHCGGRLSVLVDVPPHAISAGQLQPRTRYLKCERCAQIEIVEDQTAPSSGDLTDILEMAMAEIGAPMGNIQIFDPRTRTLSIAAQHGFKQDFLDFFRVVSADDGCACGRALQRGDRVVIEDVESDAGFAPCRMIARSAGFRAVQSSPLIGPDGRPLDMLSTHYEPVHRPSGQDFTRLQPHLQQAVRFIAEHGPL